MVLKRNTQVGKNNFKLIYLVFLFSFCLVLKSNAKSNLEGTFTDIKILDKISSKNTLLKLKNGELINFIKFINSPFLSLSRVFLELILSKIFISVKVPSKLLFAFDFKTKQKENKKTK